MDKITALKLKNMLRNEDAYIEFIANMQSHGLELYNEEDGTLSDIPLEAPSTSVARRKRVPVGVIPKEVLKGGPGSRHWGHVGRPGQHGGSLPGSVAMSVRTGKTAKERRLAAIAAASRKAKKLGKLRDIEGSEDKE